MAMALPDTSDAAHFDRTAFRTPQRIFATMPADGRTANLKLPAATQLRVVRDHPDAFEAIAGGWGRQGWTTVTLASVDKATLAPIISASPELLESLSELLAQRRMQNEGLVAEAAGSANQETKSSYKAGFLGKLRQFFEV